MSPVWNRLIRFVAADSKIYFGEPIVADAHVTVDKLFENGTLEAKVITGDVFSPDAVVSDQVEKVTQILSPLSREQVPIIKCIGLNYKAHSKLMSTSSKASTYNSPSELVAEGGRTPPPYPSVFIKPSHCLADTFEDVPITKIAQTTVDYEGELVSFILSRVRYMDLIPTLTLDHCHWQNRQGYPYF